MRILLIAAGIALTVMCWGAYGPVLHKGQEGLENSRLKPLICVGLAYFVVAIIVPTMLLSSRGELAGGWSFGGITWSLIAGTAGALGAFGIVIALSSGGSPVYVMPIVFGCAPVVSVFTAIIFSRHTERPSALFYAGLILVASGAVVVLMCKPTKAKAPERAKSTIPPAATSPVEDTRT